MKLKMKLHEFYLKIFYLLKRVNKQKNDIIL